MRGGACAPPHVSATGGINSLCLVVPIYNAATDKIQILSDNQGKFGVYCFTNWINGKQYIGSSVDLKRRFSALRARSAFCPLGKTEYFKISYLKVHKDMPICCALLKHGYSNFSLEIIGYYDSSELLTSFVRADLSPHFSFKLKKSNVGARAYGRKIILNS